MLLAAVQRCRVVHQLAVPLLFSCTLCSMPYGTVRFGVIACFDDWVVKCWGVGFRAACFVLRLVACLLAWLAT